MIQFFSLGELILILTSTIPIERVTARSDEKLEGAIVLMHVGETSTAAALPAILANLRMRKFQILTVSQLVSSGGR